MTPSREQSRYRLKNDMNEASTPYGLAGGGAGVAEISLSLASAVAGQQAKYIGAASEAAIAECRGRAVVVVVGRQGVEP